MICVGGWKGTERILKDANTWNNNRYAIGVIFPNLYTSRLEGFASGLNN